MKVPVILSVIVSLLLPPLGIAAEGEPAIDAKDLPRLQPTEPEAALRAIRVKTGFRAELVAAEPLVVDPVAMCFDEKGRLYVVEMRGYSERQNEHLGRIRLLEDTDGDGRFDKSTVFAEKLAWPTAVFCHDGGVFVGSTPDILYLKDTDNDGVSDVRRVVFTGYGAGRERLNVQALINSFRWGLDNRIHGATGPNGGSITSAAAPNEPAVALRGLDFSFDPRRPDRVRPESGGAQHGMSFDSRGRKFVCSNSHHIQSVMYDVRYALRNPHYVMPPAVVDIAVDGPAAEVYRLSPDEAWRVIRTEWRVSGKVKGAVEGGGRASGYFTGATGVTIYQGDAFPREYADDAFIGDAGSNLIHHKKINPDGVGVLARRAADEQRTEFLASPDNWFRPVQFDNGPDGALYVLDMYREVIEHPWSIPDSIKQHLDLNSGSDRGRIYRVVPQGFKQPKLPKLGSAPSYELVGLLGHPNGWYRDTAARLLYERQDKAAIPVLGNYLAKSPSAIGRMRALYALDGLGALSEAQVAKALNDPDEVVREHAVRLSEKFINADGLVSAALMQSLRARAGDPAARVRYQLAFTLGELRSPEKVPLLAAIIRRDIDSKWTHTAVLSSLSGGAGEMFAALAGDPAVRNDANGLAFLSKLATVVGTRNDPAEVDQVMELLSTIPDVRPLFTLAQSLGEGLQRSKSSLTAADRRGRLRSIYAHALVAVANVNAAEVLRVQAVHVLGAAGFDQVGRVLMELLNPNQPQAVQLAAIAALSNLAEPAVGSGLVNRWDLLTPRLRGEALSTLLARPERIQVLLSALESGVIRPSDLSSTQIKFLLSHKDKGISGRSAGLLAGAVNTELSQTVEKYRPALGIRGSAPVGREIYLARCASCHRAGGDGHPLGPDLASIRSSGKETMLANIIDPNREVPPNYLSYVIETRDGESLIGLVANETAASVTLRQAGGSEMVVMRSNIESMRSQGQSVMPEGLEAGLSLDEMAGLLEFLVTAEPGR